MPFTVLSVACPFALAGPRCVGETEQILTEEFDLYSQSTDVPHGGQAHV